MRRWRQIFAAGCLFAAVLTACGRHESNSAVSTTMQESVAIQEDMTSKSEIKNQEDITKTATTQSEATTEAATTQSEATTEAATTQSETTTEAATMQAETTTEVTTTQAEATTEVTTTQAETTTEVTTTQAETTTEAATTQEATTAARQSVPGIVCWGDSLTYGYGGNGESYPATLLRLINERLGGGIPVVNNGVCVEQTYTIMARAGVWSMTSNRFTIPADCTPVEIHVELKNGMYTNLTAFGDAGLNPVTIGGIRGNLTNSYNPDGYGYCYFTRLEPGQEVEIEQGTTIYPASTGMYDGYINVIFMGENGVYANAEDLISQYQLFIDTKGLSRYIIIGLTTGDNNSRGEMSQKMSSYFGSKYIDMRTELVNRGPELVGLERQTGDWYNVQEGSVMKYLMSDDIHLNEYGYRAMGMIVYERMEALGYFQ